jgi:hypothetical protein
LDVVLQGEGPRPHPDLALAGRGDRKGDPGRGLLHSAGPALDVAGELVAVGVGQDVDGTAIGLPGAALDLLDDGVEALLAVDRAETVELGLDRRVGLGLDRAFGDDLDPAQRQTEDRQQ